MIRYEWITIAFILAAISLIAFQLRVSLQLLKFFGCSRGQKIAQLILIWLTPFVGALVVRSVIQSTAPPFQRGGDQFPSEGGGGDTGGGGGGCGDGGSGGCH